MWNMTWSKTDQDFSSPDKLPTNRKNDSVICYWLRHMQTCSPDPITNSKNYEYWISRIHDEPDFYWRKQNSKQTNKTCKTCLSWLKKIVKIRTLSCWIRQARYVQKEKSNQIQGTHLEFWMIFKITTNLIEKILTWSILIITRMVFM